MNALPSEWGAIGNLRFLVSTIGSQTANASSSGKIFIIFSAWEWKAYACVEQDGYSAHSFIGRQSMMDL